MRSNLHSTYQANRAGSFLLWLAIGVAVGLLGALAPASHAQEGPDAISTDEVRGGELLWRSPQGWIPLPVLDVDVEISITGIMAYGKVTQRFRNATSEVIEALYAFPLPERAAVHAMEMRIGDRRIVSTIQEREEARRTYERAKKSGKKAALVEQHRPNLFTTAAANINPGESIDVVLEYFEEVAPVAGVYELAFPLAYTPRYWPSGTEAIEEGSSLPEASITVRLQAGFELSNIGSESHSLDVTEEGSIRVIRPAGGRILADRDFLVSWIPRRTDAPQTAVFSEERDGERYALIMVLPPAAPSEIGQGLPTETLFVIDVSGSMAGASMTQAREALLAALERLRPEDRFNLIRFNDKSAVFRDRFQQAEPEALDAATAWVRDLHSGGGTQIYPALMRAVAMAGQSSSSHAQRIVFLTDGAVGNEQEILRAIHERLGEIRLHTVGIGQAPNRYLMRKMAHLGRGLCEFISAGASAQNRIDTFFSRLDRPVLRDVELAFKGVTAVDLYPQQSPDLYAGEPLLISARLVAPTGEGTLEMGGFSRTGWLAEESALGRETESPGVAVRWARAKVESLMDSMLEGADAGDVRREVIDLALTHHLVTRFTSLIAVEEIPTALGDASLVKLSAALPQGGTSNPLKRLLAVLLGLGGLSVVVLLRPRVA